MAFWVVLYWTMSWLRPVSVDTDEVWVSRNSTSMDACGSPAASDARVCAPLITWKWGATRWLSVI
jgi:hypothetical protein